MSHIILCICYSAGIAQLYFFIGQNAYRMREERRTWKERFVEKHGEENLLTLSGGDVTFRTLLDEVGIAPFIGEKRLVIIDGTPTFSKEEIESLPTQMHPDCLLLICDSKPDKRLGSVKALLQVATVKEFAPMESGALLQWMRASVLNHESDLPLQSAQVLRDIAGEDQETLSHELEKLSLFTGKGTISTDAVRRLAVPSGEQQVWQLTTDVANGQTSAAIIYARDLLLRGEDPFSLWSVLLWMLRSLVTVHAAVESGQRDPAAITKLGVPFPTVRTLLPFAQRLSTHTLQETVEWAANADVDLKTGMYKASGDAPQELHSLIDSLIIRCGFLGAGSPSTPLRTGKPALQCTD